MCTRLSLSLNRGLKPQRQEKNIYTIGCLERFAPKPSSNLQKSSSAGAGLQLTRTTWIKDSLTLLQATLFPFT